MVQGVSSNLPSQATSVQPRAHHGHRAHQAQGQEGVQGTKSKHHRHGKAQKASTPSQAQPAPTDSSAIGSLLNVKA